MTELDAESIKGLVAAAYSIPIFLSLSEEIAMIGQAKDLFMKLVKETERRRVKKTSKQHKFITRIL